MPRPPSHTGYTEIDHPVAVQPTSLYIEEEWTCQQGWGSHEEEILRNVFNIFFEGMPIGAFDIVILES